eukprot:jgi/Phyca11/126084/e_gw1.61.238.1
MPRFAFAASPTWMGTFLSRYSLARRAKTRQGQTTPADSARVAREFTAIVRRRIVEEGIIKVYNADQTAPVMLMWDDFSAHWTPEVVEFAVEKNIVLQRIPPGYTHCCQPADIAWNKPLKDRIRASWTTYLKAQCSKALVSSGESSPKLIPPDRKRVLQWLHTAWNDLTVKTIKGGYKHVDLLFDERTAFSNEDVGADKIDEELADTLRALSWLDDSAGDVSWDDDVVDRHTHK